ncbi:MAG: hypothetical protein Q9227_006833 [Pyrenula ochraceoflavens]
MTLRFSSVIGSGLRPLWSKRFDSPNHYDTSSKSKQADIYEREGDIEQAYFLRFRYAHLMLSSLPTHPEVNDPVNRKFLKEAQRSATRIINQLELANPKINKRYEQYQKLLQERQARKQERERLASITGGNVRTSTSSLEDHHGASEELRNRRLKAEENTDLAVSLARQELPRRIAERKATRQAGVGQEEENRRRRGIVWDGSQDDDLSRQLQEVGARINSRRPPPPQPEKHRQRLPIRPEASDYNYPSIPSQHHNKLQETPKTEPTRLKYEPPPPALPPKDALSSTHPPPTPVIPSKQPLSPTKQSTFLHDPSLPPLPSKTAISLPTPSQTPIPEQPQPQPPYTFAPSAHLESGTPLRTLFLPPTLRSAFLHLAHSNTSRNLETCGVLAGSLIANALFISHLIIPDQTSTSDTCETINESALFDYVDAEDLMVFGWIHTHPSQSCFMSSRDLHTHCGYQVMIAESIAIVCAPSVASNHGGGREWGAFRLTDPPGMKTILGCKKEGTFHPHEGFGGDGINGSGEGEGGLYVDARRPGHVVEAGGLEFVVKDLRPGI